jgi:enoyl-CoA hydratase/carnithine racemase
MSDVTATTLVSHHPNIVAVRDGDVVTVTIDRPASKNGCTGAMWVAIGRVFRELSYSGARVVVISGSGGNFCSGADLSGSQGSGETGPPTNMIHGMRVLGEAVLAIHSCPIPVVAKVDGLCVGAGLGLALAADLTWCADSARFSAIFAKRGLSLDFGTSWLLRQRIGVHRAKELTFTAKILSGTEAHALGLVNAVVPAAELDAATEELVQTIAAGPPLALSMTKRGLDMAGSSSLAHALEVEAMAQSVNVKTDDMREAFVAYAERRAPKFIGE